MVDEVCAYYSRRRRYSEGDDKNCLVSNEKKEDLERAGFCK